MSCLMPRARAALWVQLHHVLCLRLWPKLSVFIDSVHPVYGWLLLLLMTRVGVFVLRGYVYQTGL